MELDIKGIDFVVDENTRDLIKNKLSKLDFMSEHIIYLNFSIRKDNSHIKVEADAHLNWGIDVIVSHQGYDVNVLIDDVINTLQNKLKKEKDKKQEHHK